MRKIFAIALIAGLVWAGLTVFTEGTDGLLARLQLGREQARDVPIDAPLERIRSHAAGLRERQDERLERQLGREPER